MRGIRSDTDLSKVEAPFKLNIADCLWILRIVDIRIKGGQSNKMLKELSKYPFKSSSLDLLIRQLSRPKLGLMVQDVLEGLKDNSSGLF